MCRFIRLQTEAQIWYAVGKTFYDGTYETQLFELNRKSFNTRQNERSLPTYYNELVIIFQEIDIRLTTQEATVDDTIGLNKTMTRFHVYIFLAGLDADFNQERSEIMRKDLPLSLESSYAYIHKDQNQRQTKEKTKLEPDCMVHIVSRHFPQKEKNSNGKKSKLTCTHCEEGHSKLKCYRIIGYPEWWDFSKKLSKKLDQVIVASSGQTQEEYIPMAAHTSTASSDCHINTKLKITVG